MTGDDAFAALLRELGRRSQADIAREIGVSEPTVSRWARLSSAPGGANLARLVSWAERLPANAPSPALPPVAVPGDYWRGVLYAAEAMSETVARLLREARETAEANAPRLSSAEAYAPLHSADAPLEPTTPAAPTDATRVARKRRPAAG